MHRLAVILVAVLVAGCGDGAGVDGEIVLDENVVTSARAPAETAPDEAPPAPRGGASNGARGMARGEAIPKRVLRENAQLRREVKVLEQLARDRKRIKAELAKLGAFDGSVALGSGVLGTPVRGPIVSPFGPRWGRLHAGIDIAAPAGRPVFAAADGRVVIANPVGGYGNYVCVQHSDRLVSCYAHLSRYLTRRGAIVRRGDAIGLVGCTGHCFGDHLHFETYVDAEPVDPVPFLAEQR